MIIKTNNGNRTVFEMHNMFAWCMETFGEPTTEPMRWTYGKDVDWMGRTMCNDPYEIEWLEFANEDDAILFRLRFGL